MWNAHVLKAILLFCFHPVRGGLLVEVIAYAFVRLTPLGCIVITGER